MPAQKWLHFGSLRNGTSIPPTFRTPSTALQFFCLDLYNKICKESSKFLNLRAEILTAVGTERCCCTPGTPSPTGWDIRDVLLNERRETRGFLIATNPWGKPMAACHSTLVLCVISRSPQGCPGWDCWGGWAGPGAALDDPWGSLQLRRVSDLMTFSVSTKWNPWPWALGNVFPKHFPMKQ